MREYRMGQVREDGLIFWEYSKIHKNGERWVTPEKFIEIRERKRLTAIKRLTPEVRASRLLLRRQRYHSDSEYRKLVLDRVNTYQRNRVLTEGQKLARNERVRTKRNTCALRCLKHRLRCYINKAINKSAINKSTEEILGCSFEEFLCHIESKFKTGMTWENRSKWHVDHEIPLATAQTQKQVLKLFHYKNLQPLWAFDNLSKGAKYNKQTAIKHE